MNYEFADKAIRDMNRRNLRAFDGIKTLKFDELNVMKYVTKVYEDAVKLAKKRYLQIALEAYRLAKGKKKIDRDWILDMLEEYDPVTMYLYEPEAERKKDRTVEAVLSSPNKIEAVDKALKLWTLQNTHYAEKSVDKATLQAFEDNGIEKVRWVTAEDEKVCEECRKRDGKIYPIDKLPPKPHYRCRCTYEPVK